jgi:hypothetical protein
LPQKGLADLEKQISSRYLLVLVAAGEKLDSACNKKSKPGNVCASVNRLPKPKRAHLTSGAKQQKQQLQLTTTITANDNNNTNTNDNNINNNNHNQNDDGDDDDDGNLPVKI